MGLDDWARDSKGGERIDQARIGRFHNIYGPCGTWKGGREKVMFMFW